MNRPEIVFVLGAGASAPSGCPTLARFFESMYLHASTKEDPSFQRDVQTVLTFQRKLRDASSVTRLNSMNIEEVLSLLDMAISLGGGFGMSAGELLHTRAAAARAIRSTIINSQWFYSSAEYIEPHSGSKHVEIRNIDQAKYWCKGYDHLTESISLRLSGGSRMAITFISMNYDIGLETCLRSARLLAPQGLNRGCEDRDSNQNGQVRVYKLHGSVDLIRDESADSARKYRLRPVSVARHTPLQSIQHADKVIARSELASDDAKRRLFAIKQRCTSDIEPIGESTPHIVSPSDNKLADLLYADPDWIGAAKSVSNATVICFIGYSFPPSDLHFRRFLSISLASNRNLSGVFVADLCDDDTIKERFKNLFGTDLLWMTGGRVHALRAHPIFCATTNSQPGDSEHAQTFADLWNLIDATANLYDGLGE